jgi:molybdopterin-biosynthesis enzyme MoeA-like protein
MAKRVGIVILGDEVLKGEIREANLAHMIPRLAEWGAETALCAICGVFSRRSICSC